jgi:hypothetical protein
MGPERITGISFDGCTSAGVVRGNGCVTVTLAVLASRRSIRSL